jgi:HPt (histidine-containing phosphotransfer) domain-containing protein
MSKPSTSSAAQSSTFGVVAAGSACPDVLDAKALDKLRELDPKGNNRLLERVLNAYAQSLQKLLAQMPAAVAPGDADLVRLMAHTLKSSSASVGALDMAARCAEAEKAVKDGELATWQASVPVLRAEAQRVLDGLARAGYVADKSKQA